MRAAEGTILILGGTREAAEIAAALGPRAGLRVISSLAGRTREPRPVAGETRVGGFGGAAGLAAFLEREGVDILIDATHPFAERISTNAATATRRTGTRLIRLVRPPWTAVPGDRWQEADSLTEAAAALPAGAKALLALGSQHLAAFASRPEIAFVVRMVDPPAAPLPLARYDLVLGRASTDSAAEAELLRAHAVTHLVCRNSGGAGAYAKLAAARDLGLPLIMIARPEIPDAGETFAQAADLLAAI